MNPILTIEFTAKTSDGEFKEESISVHSPEELFTFVAPGGGCELIPSEVEEIQIVLFPPKHVNKQNPIADLQSSLQMCIVLINGPLSEIVMIAEQIIDKAGRNELSEAFLRAIGRSN